MALDLKLLDKPLTAAENPGLDTLDPRFQEIAGLVENGDYAKAAEQTEALIREDILDVRVIGYYLYGIFSERGLGSLGDILGVISRLFGENFEAVGPAKKRDVHFQSGIGWFLNRIVKRLGDEEKKKGDDWNAWIGAVNAETAGAYLEKSDALNKAMLAKMQSPKLSDPLKKLQDWLKAYQKLVYVPEKPAEKPAEAPKEEKAEAKPGGAAAARGGAAVAGGEQVVFDRPMAEGSFHLQELIDRLKAFEVLCQRKQFEKASLVAAEIAATIEKFDPRLYFPRLFAGYSSLLAQHFDAISKHWENKEQPAWKAQEQLLRVDLAAFVGR